MNSVALFLFPSSGRASFPATASAERLTAPPTACVDEGAGMASVPWQSMGRLVVGLALIGGFSISVSAVGLTRPKQQYSKTSVTFNKATFDLAYGQTTTLCATVKGPKKDSVTFVSDPVGTLIVQKTTVEGCTAVGLSVKSSDQVCLAQAKVSAKLNTKTIKSSVATIILPTKDVATFYQNHSCTEAGSSPPGGIVDWTITFSGTSPASFDGLFANETLTAVPPGEGDPMSCGVPTPAPGGRTIGQVGPNQVPDNLGTCDQVHFPNCQSVFLQTVKVGACTVQTNKLYFIFSNGSFFTKREDPSGSTQVVSPPIAQ